MKRDLKNSFLLFAVIVGLTLSAGEAFAGDSIVSEQQGFSADFVRSVFEKDVIKEYNSRLASNVNDPDTDSTGKKRIKLRARRDKVKT